MNSPNQIQSENHYGNVSLEDLRHVDKIITTDSDEELESAIKELLLNSNKLNADDIHVSVDNSNVTLSGTVHSQYERDYAISVVKLVQGVGDVWGDLIVKLNEGILPTDIGRDPN